MVFERSKQYFTMILVDDDSPENLFSIKSLLELNAHPTDIASGGEQALKKILKIAYALIIMDIQMPDKDSFEVAETISGYCAACEPPKYYFLPSDI